MKTRVFQNLLPASHNAFTWNKDLPPDDTRNLPNVYLKMLRQRTIALLMLADIKMQVVTTEEAYDMYIEPNAFASTHPSNINYHYLLEATQHLKEIEAALPRLLWFPSRYFVQFGHLKLKWRRFVCMEGRIGRPFFESVDPHLEFSLRDSKCPMPLEPIFRSFYLRNQKASLVKPEYRWSSDPLQESLDTFLKEVRSVLRIAVKEAGSEHNQLTSLMYETFLEVLSEYKRLTVGEKQAAYKNHFLCMSYQLFQILLDLDTKMNAFENDLLDVTATAPEGGSAGIAKFLVATEIQKLCGGQVALDLAMTLHQQLKAEYDQELTEDEIAAFAKGAPGGKSGPPATNKTIFYGIDPQFPNAAAVHAFYRGLRKQSQELGYMCEDTVSLCDMVGSYVQKAIPSFVEKTMLPAAKVDNLATAVGDAMPDARAVLGEPGPGTPVTTPREHPAPSTVDLAGQGMTKPGEILMHWLPVQESNPLDYWQDGHSCIVLLGDQQTLHQFTGYIPGLKMRKLYDIFYNWQNNATSEILEGNYRTYFTDMLMEFATLFFDFRYQQLAPIVKDEGGATDAAKLIGTQELKGFNERASMPQDPIPELEGQECKKRT